MPDLIQTILKHAYILDQEGFDALARRLSAVDWASLTRDLNFGATGTGGGLMMMAAVLPQGHTLEVTDGEADLPSDSERFHVGIVDPDGQEVLAVSSAHGS